MAATVYHNAMQWAAAQGIRVHGVAPTEIPGLGLGMVATRVIEVSIRQLDSGERN